MEPKYEVPIVPQNLRREETVIQIAEALNYLTDVSNDIFKRINDRIKKNSIRINEVNNRITAASTKLTKLSGAKKATQVFSSSKYPATDINQQYISVFSDKEVLPIKRFPYSYKTVHLKDEPLETLKFYHVDLRGKTEKEEFKGLGEIPLDITVVNDLILFNSGKNLYDNYILSDTLDVSRGSSKKEEIKDVSEIGAAPLSISDRISVIKNISESYFYSPDLGNVPTIDVPIDLPDLPGIADDLRFVSETLPGIAPSVHTTPSVPDLPAIIQDPILPNEILPEIVDEVKIEPVQKIVTRPAEILTAPVIEKVEITTTDSVEKKIIKNVKEVVKRPIEITDDRANLMEAIRKAGGSKTLKSTESTEKAPTVSTGNFLDDLHAKLSMRRKGISGNKPDSEPKSAMEKVSAMIPPPPTKTPLTESTEDEEWED